jgi:hypothetical protein
VSELSPSARALIDAARPAVELTSRDRDALEVALAARLGPAVFAPTGAAGAPGSAAGAAGTKAAAGAGTKIAVGAVGAKTAMGALLAKPVAVGVLGAVAIWGGVQVTQNARTHNVHTPEASSAALAAPGAAVLPRALEPSTPSFDSLATAEALPMLPTAEPLGAAEPAGPLPVALPQSALTRPRSAALKLQAPARAPANVLGSEARLLRDALTAMQAGDGERALLLLDEHASRFPKGSMRGERMAERVLILCGLGRADVARGEASRFLSEFSETALAPRVRASCGGTR